MNEKSLFFKGCFVLIIVFMGCRPVSIIGDYSDYKGNKIRFAGKELAINKDGTFVFNEWTDNYVNREDENGNIICDDLKGKGVGTYQILNDTIELHFTNNDFLTYQVKIAENARDFEIEIEIIDELSKPFVGATFMIESMDRKVIESGISDKKGRNTFKISKEKNPQFLKISAFGIKELSLSILENKGNHRFERKRCFGYYANQDIEKLWYKVSRNYIQYQIKGRRLVKLKRID